MQLRVQGKPSPVAYDSSDKRRVPAYTDRIFFRGSGLSPGQVCACVTFLLPTSSQPILSMCQPTVHRRPGSTWCHAGQHACSMQSTFDVIWTLSETVMVLLSRMAWRLENPQTWICSASTMRLRSQARYEAGMSPEVDTLGMRESALPRRKHASRAATALLHTGPSTGTPASNAWQTRLDV